MLPLLVFSNQIGFIWTVHGFMMVLVFSWFFSTKSKNLQKFTKIEFFFINISINKEIHMRRAGRVVMKRSSETRERQVKKGSLRSTDQSFFLTRGVTG